MPYGQVDRICKLVPNNPAKPVTLAAGHRRRAALQEARDDDRSWRRCSRSAQQLEGLYRHASTHAAGVVIGDRPLDECAALPRSAPRCLTQYNMKWVEQPAW